MSSMRLTPQLSQQALSWLHGHWASIAKAQSNAHTAGSSWKHSGKYPYYRWKWHDSNELDEIVPEPFAFYMMDKAYVDFLALFRFHKAGAYWISRPKDNMRYEVVNHSLDFDPSTGICGDFIIKLTTHKSKKLYPEPIRMVTYHDSVTGNDVEFITNNFEISALEVANLYRHRWDVEVFFKWIKQNIVVKNLWGYSENAVRTHLWVAIIAYLIIAKSRLTTKVRIQSPRWLR